MVNPWYVITLLAVQAWPHLKLVGGVVASVHHLVDLVANARTALQQLRKRVEVRQTSRLRQELLKPGREGRFRHSKPRINRDCGQHAPNHKSEDQSFEYQ